MSNTQGDPFNYDRPEPVATADAYWADAPEEPAPERTPEAPVPAGEEPAALQAIDFITRKSAKEAREQRARGFIFNLKSSGGKAHVRRLAIMERAVIMSLPPVIQQKVIQATAEAQHNKSAIKPSGSIDMKTYVGNVMRNEEAYNAVCVAGFIRPRLVMTESLLTGADDEVVVTDIDIFDRHAFFMWCNGGDVEPDRLAPFLG